MTDPQRDETKEPGQDARAPGAQKPRRNLWPFAPIAILVIPIVAQTYILTQATGDPSHVIEDDYYRKAVNWDEHMAQERTNQALGWALKVNALEGSSGDVTVQVELRDKQGRAIEDAKLKLVAFHNARSAQRTEVTLEHGPRGYEATLPLRRPGLWELRFEAERGLDRFTQVVRRDLHVGEGGT